MSWLLRTHDPVAMLALIALTLGLVSAGITLWSPEDEPWRRRLVQAVFGLLFGWFLVPFMIFLFLVQAPGLTSMDTPDVLRMRVRNSASATLWIVPGLGLVGFGWYLLIHAAGEAPRDGWGDQLGLLLMAVPALVGGAWLVRFAIRRRRTPADALLVDFLGRTFTRVDGRHWLGRCGFDELGALKITVVDVTYDPPDRRPGAIRVHEHQLTCAGMPGVVLFYGGSPEESGEIADRLRGWANGSMRP